MTHCRAALRWYRAGYRLVYFLTWGLAFYADDLSTLHASRSALATFGVRAYCPTGTHSG
jgi:hypothetical protein